MRIWQRNDPLRTWIVVQYMPRSLTTSFRGWLCWRWLEGVRVLGVTVRWHHLRSKRYE